MPFDHHDPEVEALNPHIYMTIVATGRAEWLTLR